MRASSIASEAWKNIRMGSSKFALMSSLFALIGGLSCSLEIATTSQLVADADRFRAVGASIEVTTAIGSIDGTTCDSLSSITGVASSGSIAPAQPILMATLPNTPIQNYRVSRGFPQVLDVEYDGSSGLLLSTQLAESIGARVGDYIRADNDDIRIAGIFKYPDDGRDGLLAFAALSVTDSAATFDQCWLDTVFLASRAPGLGRISLEADLAPDLQVTSEQLNSSLGRNFDGVTMYRERVSAWSGLATFVIVAFLSVLWVRWRRLELVSARHAGVDLTAQSVQLLLETFAWTLAGAMLTAPTWIMARWLFPVEENFDASAAGTLLTLLGGICGGLAGTCAGLLSVSPRAMYKYFKER